MRLHPCASKRIQMIVPQCPRFFHHQVLPNALNSKAVHCHQGIHSQARRVVLDEKLVSKEIFHDQCILTVVGQWKRNKHKQIDLRVPQQRVGRNN
ncbi:unnamed protein product [Schistosoma mattheei]|uniref:Uncharacterized protein n=1 Tax=Schistosoma mattheei TaxID=31246 RepID=A0A183PIA6_9TREM|nr:unnamed protein product [Schistosoma mattheei]